MAIVAFGSDQRRRAILGLGGWCREDQTAHVEYVGYDLCPRLKSFPDRRLHVPKGNRIKIPESLKEVVLADIPIADMENGWTEFSAVCDAVAAGRISAVLACERFGSASRGERAYKAGTPMVCYFARCICATR
jgi:hypothetical protein